MKSCNRCLARKDISEFYTDPSKIDGHRYECKRCSCAAKRLAGQSKEAKLKKKVYFQSEEYKIIKKKYNQSEKGKQKNLASTIARYHRLFAAGKARHDEYLRKCRAWKKTEAGRACADAGRIRLKDRGRYRVYSKVFAAIRRGSLIKLPCEVCGYSLAQAHHDDYSKPLAVRWLCIKHHSEFHNQKN